MPEFGMYQPYPLPTLEEARQKPNLITDSVTLHNFQWLNETTNQLETWPFWIQDHSFLFSQIATKPSAYQCKNIKTLFDFLGGRARHIVDVGLNIGLMSAQYSRVADKVTAFEPTPKLMQMAAANLRLNGVSNVTLYELALSSKAGIGNFTDITDNGAINRLTSATAHLKTNRKSSTCFQVQVETLDSFGFDDVDAIKIDTEGSEFEILKGAEQTIMRCRPIVEAELMETTMKKWKNDDGSAQTPRHAVAWMLERDYRMFDIRGIDLGNKWTYVRGHSDIFFVPREKVQEVVDHKNCFNDIFVMPSAEQS